MKCPHCATDLPNSSRFCSRCGREVDPSRAVREAASTKACISCGALNAKGMTKCGSCGAALDSSAAVIYMPPPPPRSMPSWAPQGGNRCPRCGAVLSDPARCPSCGWVEFSASVMKPGMSTTLNIASILLLGAGIATMFSVIMSVYQLSDPNIFEGTGLGSQLIDAVEDMVACCITIMGVAAVFSFLTAFMLRTEKRNFTLCLAGAGIAILGVGPMYISSALALIALVMIAISGDDF